MENKANVWMMAAIAPGDYLKKIDFEGQYQEPERWGIL